MIVQEVKRVAQSDRPLPLLQHTACIERQTGWKVAACSKIDEGLIQTKVNSFVAAVDIAFSSHYPLVLSPDMFWIIITMGVATHINENPAQLRDRFTSSNEKTEVKLFRNDFKFDDPDNAWNEVIEDMTVLIAEKIGQEQFQRFLPRFSTTGPVERLAACVVLLDAVKSYYDFQLETLCGIPEVRLLGESADWRSLVERTRKFEDDYDLGWWIDRIVPTLERIAENVSGNNDPSLWQSFYKKNEGSGGPYVTGWIVDFFPYLKEVAAYAEESFVENSTAHSNSDKIESYNEGQADAALKKNWALNTDAERSVTSKNLPGGLNTVPFKWKYLTKTYNMGFLAGFTGVKQNQDDLSVMPHVGWAVCRLPNIS